jgi:hypothetical protein
VTYYDKEMERNDLEYFLRARESATGEHLNLVTETESPDFICNRIDGSQVGIEHTKIEYNPEYREILESCRRYDGELDNFALLWAAAGALVKKEAKRTKSHWKLPDATILVLDLHEGYRVEVWPDCEEYSDEFSDSGFLEVWISDHSSIETHGEVTAIGLYPQSIWGIHGQGYLWAPP